MTKPGYRKHQAPTSWRLSLGLSPAILHSLLLASCQRPVTASYSNDRVALQAPAVVTASLQLHCPGPRKSTGKTSDSLPMKSLNDTLIYIVIHKNRKWKNLSCAWANDAALPPWVAFPPAAPPSRADLKAGARRTLPLDQWRGDSEHSELANQPLLSGRSWGKSTCRATTWRCAGTSSMQLLDLHEEIPVLSGAFLWPHRISQKFIVKRILKILEFSKMTKGSAFPSPGSSASHRASSPH